MEITSNVVATPGTSTSTISDITGIIPNTTISTIPGTTISTIEESTISTISATTNSTIPDTITDAISDTSFDASSSTDSNMKSQATLKSTATTSILPNIKTILTMPGGKRKQKILWRDENAPKAPLSAYLQFLNKTRETLRGQNPGMSNNEITKFLGTMWNEMPLDKKQVYLDQAERDKKKYTMELEQYHKSDSYKRFIEQRENALKVLKQEEKASPGSHLICIPCNKWFESVHNFREHVRSRKHQRNILEAQTRGKNTKKSAVNDRSVMTVAQKKTTTQGIPISKTTTQVNNFPDMSKVAEGDLNVPIFSDAFLHYNKGRESELRKLRKSTTELEEQNAILSKHIDNLNSAICKLQDDKVESEGDIKTLEPFLESFHEFLSRQFSKSGILDLDTQLKEKNIQEFLVQLTGSCDDTMTLKTLRLLNELDYPNCLNNKS